MRLRTILKQQLLIMIKFVIKSMRYGNHETNQWVTGRLLRKVIHTGDTHSGGYMRGTSQ